MAKKLVRVMTPQTADLYQHDNDEQPSDVNVEETSTETNPVTQNGTGSGKQSIDKGNAMISGTRKHQ